MKPWAAAMIAVRPTEGAPSLIFSEPPSAKDAATLAAFWLHQAAVYLAPNSFNWTASMGIPLDLLTRRQTTYQMSRIALAKSLQASLTANLRAQTWSRTITA